MERLPKVMESVTGIITDPDIVDRYNHDALGIKGGFEGVARPASENELVEIIRFAFSKGIYITPQGQRTSLTGASICDKGLALSMEKMSRILDVDTRSRLALVEPGVITASLREELKGTGLAYPPDPTSQEECTLGGNVATNASGAKSLRYGSTCKWVTWVRFVDGKGDTHELGHLHLKKSASGPKAFQRPLDFLIGSEGIFGVITKIGLRLTEAPKDSFALVVYFKDLYEAIDFVTDSVSNPRDIPSSMEFFDETCVNLLTGTEGFFAPKDTKAIVCVEEELWDETNEEQLFQRWFERIKAHTDLAEETIVLRTDREKQNLRKIRHRVPEALNEESSRLVNQGGIKISTDWAVPVERLKEMFRYFEELRPLCGNMTVARYGHIGNGHPHFNFLARNPEERAMAEQVEWLLVKKAVELGGVVSGEHGIGKLKKAHLKLMYPPYVMEAMKALKSILDPKRIMAPGNIL